MIQHSQFWDFFSRQRDIVLYHDNKIIHIIFNQV